MDDLLRLLAVVRRDLGAEDVRIELGGRPSDDAHQVTVELAPSWRLVAIFAEPPADRSTAASRMRSIFDTFHDAAQLPDDGPAPGAGGSLSAEGVRARVDAELGELLGLLMERTDAEAALLIDDRSPVVWGSAGTWPFLDLDESTRFIAMMAEFGGDALAERLATPPVADWPAPPRLALTGSSSRTIEGLRNRHPTLDVEDWRRSARAARAVALVREHVADRASGSSPPRLKVQSDDLGIWARAFAGIYWLVQVFPGPYSELTVEGSSTRALPVIEKVLMSMPPIDPEPKGGKLFAFLRSVD